MSAQITHIDPEATIRKLKAKIARLEKTLAAQPAPVQEPLAFEYFKDWMVNEMPPMTTIGNPEWWAKRIYDRFTYTTPPAAQRQWVGLTQDEFRNFASTDEYGTGGLIRAIEARLREKNAAQPAVPLTDERIDRCIEAADTKWADAFVPVEWARHFARAIEAAHGITEKGQP